MLEILTDVLKYALNSCELSKAHILLRSLWSVYHTSLWLSILVGLG